MNNNETKEMVRLLDQKIDNNTYKDLKSGERGWKRQSECKALHLLQKDLSEAALCLHHIDSPIGGLDENIPTTQEITSELIDVAFRVLVLLDLHGCLDGSSDLDKKDS